MRTALWVVGVAVMGCAGSAPPEAAAATSEVEALAAPPLLDKAADSGQVDRVGPSDGALTPDGEKDLGFVVQFEGPASALFLVGVDDSGAPTGTFQADTLIGDSEGPKELGAKPGGGTLGIGVMDGEQVLNAKDGSLPDIGPGPHRLNVYVSTTPAAAAGKKIRLYVLRPDNRLVPGATLTL